MAYFVIVLGTLVLYNMSCWLVEFIGQIPHVCGGLDSRFDAITSNCWAYDVDRGQWSKSGR